MSVAPGLDDFTQATASLSADLLVASEPGLAIAALATVSVGPIEMNCPSYAIAVDAQMNAVAATGLLNVFLTWTDPATGLVMGEEQWFITSVTNGNSDGFGLHVGRGPTKGGQLTITITSYETSFPALANVYVWQSSRAVTRDDWRGQVTGTVSGPWPGPNGQSAAGILGWVDAQNVGAGTTLNRLLPLYAGQVSLTISASVYTAVSASVYCPLPNRIATNYPFMWNAVTLTGPITQAYIALPRSPTVIAVTNGSGAAITTTWDVTICEFAS